MRQMWETCAAGMSIAKKPRYAVKRNEAPEVCYRQPTLGFAGKHRVGNLVPKNEI